MSNGGTRRGKPRPEQRSDSSYLVPGDETFHEGKHLIADLSEINGQISRYVLRHLDAEVGRAVPTSPYDEHDLGMRLVRVGVEVVTRSDRRQRHALSGRLDHDMSGTTGDD